MYARLQLKNGYICLHQTWQESSLRKRRELKEKGTPEKSSSLDDGDPWNSEFKYDRRTAQGIELFVPARILQEIRTQTRKCPSFKCLGKDAAIRDKLSGYNNW